MLKAGENAWTRNLKWCKSVQQRAARNLIGNNWSVHWRLEWCLLKCRLSCLHYISLLHISDNHTHYRYRISVDNIFDIGIFYSLISVSASASKIPFRSESKPSKTHPKIYNTLHLHVVTVHIRHDIQILSLWVKIQRTSFQGVVTQCLGFAPKHTPCGECASHHRLWPKKCCFPLNGEALLVMGYF